MLIFKRSSLKQKILAVKNTYFDYVFNSNANLQKVFTETKSTSSKKYSIQNDKYYKIHKWQKSNFVVTEKNVCCQKCYTCTTYTICTKIIYKSFFKNNSKIIKN